MTAQQAYDAFMSGVVLLDGGTGVVLATGIQWCDSNGGQDDPDSVVGVRFVVNDHFFDVGNVPADWM